MPAIDFPGRRKTWSSSAGNTCLDTLTYSRVRGERFVCSHPNNAAVIPVPADNFAVITRRANDCLEQLRAVHAELA